jgi:hypothetical protein
VKKARDRRQEAGGIDNYLLNLPVVTSFLLLSRQSKYSRFDVNEVQVLGTKPFATRLSTLFPVPCCMIFLAINY